MVARDHNPRMLEVEGSGSQIGAHPANLVIKRPCLKIKSEKRAGRDADITKCEGIVFSAHYFF